MANIGDYVNLPDKKTILDYKPRTAPQLKEQIKGSEKLSRRRSSGGSSRGSRRSYTPSYNVSVSGDTVTINGQGFSVDPMQQAAFIRERTSGGSGASAQKAIELAQQNAAKLEAARKAKEAAEAAAARRARLELQAQRASGNAGVIQVPKGGTIPVDNKRIDLKQPVKEPDIRAFAYGQSIAEQPARSGRRTVMTTEQLQLKEEAKAVSDSYVYGRRGDEPLPSQITVDEPTVFKKVEAGITRGATTVNEEIYTPTKESLIREKELLDSLFPTFVNEEGNVQVNPNYDPAAGSKLLTYRKVQQAKLQQDIARYNIQYREVEQIQNNLEFRRLQNDIREINRQVEAGKIFTEEEAAAANKKIDQYNKFYNRYEKEFKKLQELEQKINRGYKGTGKEVIRDRIESLPPGPAKIKKQIQAGALNAGLIAYEAEKPVLAAQVGGAIAGKVLASSSTGRSIIQTVAPTLSTLTKPSVVAPLIGTSGLFESYKEYQRTGYAPYVIGAGIGRVAGLGGSIYSKQIVEGTGRTLATLGRGVDSATRRYSRLIIDTLRGAPQKPVITIDDKTVATQNVGTEFQVRQGGKISFASQETPSIAQQRAIARGFTKETKTAVLQQGYENFLRDTRNLNPVERTKRLNEFINTAKRIFGDSIVKEFIVNTVVPKATTVQSLPDSQTPTGGILTSRQTSPFAGTGQYERTDLVAPLIQGQQSLTQTQLLQQSQLIGFTPTPSQLLTGQSANKIQLFTETGGLGGLLYSPSNIQTGVQLETLDQQPRLSTSPLTGQSSVQNLGLVSAQDSGIASGTGTSTFSRTRQDTGQDSAQDSATDQITRLRPRPPRPRSPQETIPRIGIPDLPEFERDIRKSKGKGYYAEYRPEGQKTYKRINKTPQTLMSALSTMARKVDTTLSARGRVKEGSLKIGKDRKKVQPKDTGDNYFSRNKFKFRSFKQKKGRRGALKENEFIEKQQFRLDTPGERRKITKARQTKRRTPFGF